MIIFLIALLAISAVLFIAFMFGKSKSKKRNLFLSGIVAIATIVAIGVVNAQSGNDQNKKISEPKTEKNTSDKKTDTNTADNSTNDNTTANNNESGDNSTGTNTNTNSENQNSSQTDNNQQSDNNSQSNNSSTDTKKNTDTKQDNYRTATYELDKSIATSSIGGSTMTLEEYNSLAVGQLTLSQTLAKYGVPTNVSGGAEGSTTMNIVYPTNQTNYSVDLQFSKTSGTWVLSTKNSMKTTGISYPQYSRQ